MKLIVVTLAGRELEVEVDADQTVRTIKERVEEKEGIPPEQQRLVFQGRHIEDPQPVSAYSLGDGSRINLVLSLKGGAL